MILATRREEGEGKREGEKRKSRKTKLRENVRVNSKKKKVG